MGFSTRLVAVTALLCGLTACTGTPTGVSLAGDAHSSQDAQQRATTLLDRVYVPGAVRMTAVRNPVQVSAVEGAAPAHPSGGEGVPPALVLTPGQLQIFALSQNQVQVQRSYTVLGRAGDVVAAIERRPPDGLETVAPPFESTATSAPLSTVVAELRPTGSRGSTMQTVNVAATDLGGGRVGVDVRASVGWVGNRTTWETIPADVTDVQLGIRFADQPDESMNRNNQLTVAQVNELTARLNALTVAAPDQYALCTQPDVALATFTLSYGGHQATFGIQIGGCDEVAVSLDGVVQPVLGGDQAVSQEVASILDITLPPV